MKILYLGKFNNPWSTENYVVCALKEQGIEVKTLNHGMRRNYKGACWHYHKFRPNVVLFSKAKTSWTSKFIDYCRRRNTLTVCWQWDLYWGYRRGTKLAQFETDLVFTTDGGHDKSWKDHDIKHAVIRQGIHAPEHKMCAADYKYDVGFVGSSMYSDRRKLVRWLAKTYGGRYIRHSNTRGLDLNKALAEVKVVVGDSYNVDHYWSNRVYEITGRGGFLLHPETPGLDNEFEPGVHYVPFPRKNFSKLKELIDQYVKDDEGREKIKKAGFDHCGQHYTYGHRVKELLDFIRAA